MEERDYEYSRMDKSISKQILIVAVVNIGQLIVGWSVGWSAPIIPKLQDLETSPLSEVATDLQVSWIGSLLYIGSVVGPYVTGILSNIIGRKPCILMGGMLNVLAYILVVSTRNIGMVYAVRVISGLGMGITVVSNIVYIGEIASTNIRGILLTSTSIIGIAGTTLVYVIGPFVSYAMTGYIALIMCAIHLVCVVVIVPESPMYYAIKDDHIKGNEVLFKLGRPNEFDKIMSNKKNDGDSTSKIKDWTEIFTMRANRKSLFITFMLGAFQQTSGVAVMLFFSTTIFQLAGSSIEPDVATIIIGVTRLFSSLLAPTFVESQGRKILLLISMAACACSLSVMGVYFYLERIGSSVAGSLGWLPLLSLIVYFFCYEAGFGTIPNAIVGEMFRNNVRANGSTLAITLTWIVGFALTTSFTTMVETLGGDVTFWLFGGSCVLAFAFTYFCVPETKGKTLHEIQEMLS